MGGHAETPPPPYPLRAPCSYGRVGAEVGTGLRPRRARCCVCGGVDPQHSCGGFGDGGRAVSNSSFGRGEVRSHLGTGTAAVWGTARPPSPPPVPPARHPLGLPRGVRVSHAAPAGGGAVSAWGCAVFVGLWLCEPGWREALGCRAVASPPAAPPPPHGVAPPSSPLLPALLSRCRCKHLQLSFGSELTAKQN